MKIDINVLPDRQKEKMSEEKKIGFVLKLGLSFVAVLALLNVVFFLMQFVLKIEYQAADKPRPAVSDDSSSKENQLEKIFQNTSKQVGKISKTSGVVANWARFFVRISAICPAGIQMNNISVEMNHVKISGFSKTRDDFLDFQDKLKAEGFVFSVDLSNLVAAQDFNFDLELDVPQDYLAYR
jgi:Tfp pilus assembly protein PilN